MYSVISFTPAPGATSDENGTYGYVSVKGHARTRVEAEDIGGELSEIENDSTIAVVFGDQYLPLVRDADDSPRHQDSDDNNDIDFIEQQIEFNSTIVHLLERNIDDLRKRLRQPSEQVYHSLTEVTNAVADAIRAVGESLGLVDGCDDEDGDVRTEETPKPEEAKPEDAKPEEAKPSEVQSIDVEAHQVEDTKPSEVQPIDVEAPKVEDAKVEDVKPSEVQPIDVEAPKVEDAKVEDAKVEDAKVEDAKVEDAKPVEAKSSGRRRRV